MRILNKRTDPEADADAVYIGRPSPYGNPFELRDELQRDQVCNDYAAWLLLPAQAALRQRMRIELKGKDLLCWCSPKRCHGETIRKVVESPSDEFLFRPPVPLTGL